MTSLCVEIKLISTEEALSATTVQGGGRRVGLFKGERGHLMLRWRFPGAPPAARPGFGWGVAAMLHYLRNY